jgi:hypothetical protein
MTVVGAGGATDAITIAAAAAGQVVGRFQPVGFDEMAPDADAAVAAGVDLESGLCFRLIWQAHGRFHHGGVARET